MSEAAVVERSGPVDAAAQGGSPRWPRVGIVAIILGLLLISPEIRQLAFQALSDAYLQVTVFVGGTLAIVYAVESLMRRDVGAMLESAKRYQPFFAAFLGALPGCGGAIVVVTQYVRGYTTFGSIIAVLTATMGDAAFLLIAREPMTGLFVMAMGLGIGAITGMIVDAVHGTDFMRPERAKAPAGEFDLVEGVAGGRPKGRNRVIDIIWVLLVIPGIVLGLMIATQFDFDSWLGVSGDFTPTVLFGVAGAILCLVMWASSRRPNSHVVSCDPKEPAFTRTQRVVVDTNFVTTWVVIGFLVFELGTYFAGTGIEHWLQVWAPLVPAVSILVGFLPGCGPQVVITTLYLTGAIPFSAQIGNAIANDGDALFPAIALAPRAAIYATLYSAVPAVIVGYGWYFLFEMN
jgi:hypothetical protein